MKIVLQLLLCSMAIGANAQDYTSITNEESTVTNSSTSRMLSASRIEKQKEVELAKVIALDRQTLKNVYDELPDRVSNNGIQGRTMTLNPQKACRDIEKEYKVRMRGIEVEVLNARWDFGNGYSHMDDIPIYAEFATTAYTYTTPGRYFITITFYDGYMRPVNVPAKTIEVMVEECTADSDPQIVVNPNIHKVFL